MTMDQSCLANEPGSSWSPTTTPGSDIIEEEVEEVVQQSSPVRPRISTAGIPRRTRDPHRRKLAVEERRNSFSKRVYDSFEISVIDRRASHDGSESSSALTMTTSATTSCSDPWSSAGGTGFVEDEEDDDDPSWDQDDDVLVIPKLEPIDDDVHMEDLAHVKEQVEEPRTPTAGPAPALAKRPRGRPRKHPKPTPESQAKVTKGRSKTGCITCRKRKKKCDEAKPGCLNCEKNSVTCEGYPEKTIWKSGKEKAEEARMRRAGSYPTPRIMSLPPVINGVESEGDRMFFQHYITRLSLVFTVEGDQNNSFKNMLLPRALQHTGLMHSILALSGKHIDYRSPYGIQFLKQHPNVDVETLEERSQYHHEEAIKEIIKLEDAKDKNVVTSATYGQILCLVLQTLSDPNPTGQHRFHLQHYQRLIVESPPEDAEFLKFIHEFFQYHICADELIALPQAGTRILGADEWNLPSTVLQPAAVRLLGVSDGLFLYMSKITNIRNTIRSNMEAGIDAVVDYTSLYRAAEIDAGIRDWQPAWPSGDSRDLAGLLYKQMMWVYLWRTIYPPKTTNWKPDLRITRAVDDGLTLLATFNPRDPSQTLVLAPAFVIGCAAFEDRQRDPIRKAIAAVKAYTEYRNSDTALKVLEEVWRLMDKKDERSWDWQLIAHGMGMDFLAT